MPGAARGNRMQALLKAFWDIALCRRSPADLPDSAALLLVAGAAYAAFSALQSWLLFGPAGVVARTLADLVLLAAPLWLLLALLRRLPRYRQTLSALLGAGAVLSPFLIALVVLKEPAATSQPLALLVWAGSVAVIVWYLLVVGCVLRAALETGLFAGVALALAYVLGSAAVLTSLFPGTP